MGNHQCGFDRSTLIFALIDELNKIRRRSVSTAPVSPLDSQEPPSGGYVMWTTWHRLDKTGTRELSYRI